MSKWSAGTLVSLASLVAVVVLGTALWQVLAQDQPPRPPTRAAVAVPPGVEVAQPMSLGQPQGGVGAPGVHTPLGTAKLHTRVFKLKHSDPEEVRGVVEGLLERPSVEGAGLAVVAPDVGIGQLPGGLALGGGLGGGGGMLAPLAPTRWRTATDARTSSLIVRGADEDLLAAAEIVAVLDSAPDAPPPEVKSVRAFRLTHANSEDLITIIDTLGIGARVMPAAKARLLIAAGDSEALQEVANLIKELDVQVKDRSAEKPKADPIR